MIGSVPYQIPIFAVGAGLLIFGLLMATYRAGQTNGEYAVYDQQQAGYMEASKIPEDAADECLDGNFTDATICAHAKISNNYWVHAVFIPRWAARGAKWAAERKQKPSVQP